MIFDEAAGTYTFDNMSLSNATGSAVSILNSSGTFTFSDAEVVDPSGDAVHVKNLGSGGVVSFDGSITSSGGGDLIHIDGTSAGSTITFNAGTGNSITGNDAGGIAIFDADGDVTISPPVTINNPVNSFLQTGISIFGGGAGVSFGEVTVDIPAGTFNAGVEVNTHAGTINFQDLDITTIGTGIVGLSVFKANNVNVTGNSRVNSTGGDGIILNDVDAVDMTFETVTVNNSQAGFGGGSGITLTNIGSGSFEVTGTTNVNGANGPAGIGIDIDNAGGTFTFAEVDIDGTVLEGVSIGALFGNPGTVSINGGNITNVGTRGALVNNASRVSLKNTSVTGAIGMPAARVVSSTGTSKVSALNNVFRVAGGTANAVEIVTSAAGNLCLHAVGNDAVGSGGGFGLDFDQSGASTLAITQADFTAFGSDNPATTSLNTTGTLSFGCMTVDAAPLAAPALADVPPAVAESLAGDSTNSGEGEITPSMPLVIGILPAGKAVSIVFQAAVNETLPSNVSHVSNQGTVSGSNFADVLTDDPETTAIADPTITLIDAAVPTADLSIEKTVDNMAPREGQQVTFTVTLSNAGPDDATTIAVADAIPAGLTDAIVTPSSGGYADGVWSLTSLAAGGMATLTVVGNVDSSTTNTAEIIAVDQPDPDSTPNNNLASEDDQDSATVTIAAAAADLSLSKTVNDVQPNVGQEIVFTITVSNDGPDGASRVDVTDLLPAGLTFLRSTQTEGTYNEATGVWTIDTLPVDESETLTITAVATRADVTTNVAEVTAADQPDPDSTPANGVPGEDDQASVTVSAAGRGFVDRKERQPCVGRPRPAGHVHRHTDQ